MKIVVGPSSTGLSPLLLGRLRYDNCKFKDSLGNLVRLCFTGLKKIQNKSVGKVVEARGSYFKIIFSHVWSLRPA